jgi:hypothetical protein
LTHGGQAQAGPRSEKVTTIHDGWQYNAPINMRATHSQLWFATSWTESVCFQPPEQSGAPDAKQVRGNATIASGLIEGSQNGAPLYLHQRKNRLR